MISRTRAAVSVWEVEGLPGRGSSSKDLRPLLKGEYHSNVFDRLRQDSRKLLAAFRTFQHQFSPDGNRNHSTNAAALSPPSWNATHIVVDVHPRASTERMRGDTDIRFCTYTCTELPRVPLCCHFATYYNFPEKKSVPELNDQPTYISSLVTSFQSRILERNGMKLLACIFLCCINVCFAHYEFHQFIINKHFEHFSTMSFIWASFWSP